MKKSLRVTSSLIALLAMTLPAGCAVSDSTSSDPVLSPSLATDERPVSDEAELRWPDGASAKTPKCQDVPQAVVDQVNATIDAPLPGGSQVSWLTAHADGSLGKWLLTGKLTANGSEGGYFAVWATSSDPTISGFDGELQSVGSSTEGISSAPRLAIETSETMQDVPSNALTCGERRSRRAASES